MDGPAAKSFIAPAYGAAETTPLELVVPDDGGAVSVAFDVTRRP